jgi:Domain of unknown function (DUF4157)
MKSCCLVEPKSAATSPQPSTTKNTQVAPHPLLQWQAAIGNQATNRFIGKYLGANPEINPNLSMFRGLSHEWMGILSQSSPIQAKLVIGQPNDKYEQEADRIAQQVICELDTPSQQVLSRTAKNHSAIAREGRVSLSVKPMLQPSAGNGVSAPPNIENAIQQARDGGRSLSGHVQASMEKAFETDFSSVKIHTDFPADQLNRALNSYAFTHRQHIFFRQGMYAPETRKGKALLAHELTHSLQQRNTEAPHLQRFSIDDKPPIQWLNATEAVLSGAGATGVVFVYDKPQTDPTSNPLVVKATDDPIGETFLAGKLHQKVSGAATVKTRVATPPEKGMIPEVVERYVNWQAEAQKRKMNPLFLKAQKVKDFKDAQTIYVMGRAKGDDFADITQNTPDTMQSLLQNPNYLKKIGMIHAVDLFLGNTDRFELANFGNWMTDSQINITLLDNFDANSLAATFSKFRDKEFDVAAKDPFLDKTPSPVDRLAPAEIQTTAEQVVEQFKTRLTKNFKSGDWLDQKKQEFMVTHIKIGLQVGRKKLLSQLAPTFGKRSRSLKQEVIGREGGLGQQGWENIKARAKYVKKLR